LAVVVNADTAFDLTPAIQLLTGLRIAVLTGAGLSTDSGIPDYRGPDSPPRKPMTYQQFVSDADYRRTYWARNQIGWRHVQQTRPNDGHRALARLEASGIVTGLITQNVDRLHTVAGSRATIDLHGTYARVICLDCGATSTRDEVASQLDALNPGFVQRVPDVEIAPDADAVIASTEGFVVADCAACGGMLKPDIVYFGENVPRPRVQAAYEMVDEADALLVAGSSLTVQSGLRFVRHASNAAKPILIINRGTTRGDPMATLKIDAGCTPVLLALAVALTRVRRANGALS
jgi:NAD-dependent SIR2 family protein deacetylase